MVRRPAGLICPLSSGAGQVQPMGGKGWFCFLLCPFFHHWLERFLAGLLRGAACRPPHQRVFLEATVALHTAKSPSLQRTQH